MAKALFLAALLILANGCQIYTMDMNKAPKRWVTVLDADAGAPLGGIALAYHDTRKPYFIVSSVVESRAYVSGSNGMAHVPRSVHLQTAWKSGYTIDTFRHPYPPPRDADVYYVRTVDSHMTLLGERLQNEKR